MKRLILFIILLLAIGLVNAQGKRKPLGCGTPYKIADFAKNMDRTAAAPFSNTPIRIKLFVVNFTNSIYFDADAEIRHEVELMNGFYAPHNICFELIGIQNSNEWGLNVMRVDLDSQVAKLHKYRIANIMTMFVHAAIFKSPNDEIGGTAYDIPNTYFSLSEKNFGVYSGAHEAGHCLGLFHTFHGNPGFEDDDGTCEEYANGSNGSSCGDYVADTRPDPFGLSGASVSTACVYNGTAKDSRGTTYTNPPLNNAMNYWGVENENCLIQGFTLGQAERARLAVVTPLAPLFFYQVDQSNVTLTGFTVNGGTIGRATTGTIQLNNYKITNANGGFAGKRITLTPGSKVTVTEDYTNFILKPTTCQ